MINKVQLIGRWTQDPELRYTNNGKAVCNCRIAVNDGIDSQGNQITDYFNVVSWSKMAEAVANYTNKGYLVYVEGKLKIRKYQDRNSNDKYVTEIQNARVVFLSAPKGNGGQNTNEGQSAKNSSDIPSGSEFDGFGSEIGFNTDDVPF